MMMVFAVYGDCVHLSRTIESLRAHPRLLWLSDAALAALANSTLLKMLHLCGPQRPSLTALTKLTPLETLYFAEVGVVQERIGCVPTLLPNLRELHADWTGFSTRAVLALLAPTITTLNRCNTFTAATLRHAPNLEYLHIFNCATCDPNVQLLPAVIAEAPPRLQRLSLHWFAYGGRADVDRLLSAMQSLGFTLRRHTPDFSLDEKRWHYCLWTREPEPPAVAPQ